MLKLFKKELNCNAPTIVARQWWWQRVVYSTNQWTGILKQLFKMEKATFSTSIID